MESNDTRVLSSIETLGENATTKRVAGMAGLSAQTIERVALKYGYKRAFHGGPWLSTDDVVRSDASNEQIEVLNRMANAIESLAGKLNMTAAPNGSNTYLSTLRPGVTKSMANEAAVAGLAHGADLETRKRSVDTLASYLLADTLQS